MNIDLKKLIRVSDFHPEDKKRILEGFDTLPPQGILELWQLCLENLQWKVEIEFSKRFHESVLNGVTGKNDQTNYKDLEKEILLEIFTHAEVDAREDEIEQVRNMLQSIKDKTQPSVQSTSPRLSSLI